MLVQNHSRIRRIETLLKVASNTELDDFIVSQLCQLVCIKIAGNIEKGIASIITAYAKNRGNKQLQNAIGRMVSKNTNLNCDRIVQALAAFDDGWAAEAQVLMTGETKDSIDSVHANRNRISHGEDVGISLSRARQFAAAHRRLLEKLEKIILG
jgi:hypothetical protein